MARRKKYTPAAFSRAVDKYFNSISYDVTEKYDNGEEILNREGNRIETVQFAVPPTLSGLCRELCISRDTFASYAADDEYSDTCSYAREVVEAYLECELLTRTKGIEGIKFNLQNNFGWNGAQHEVELGADTRKALTVSSLTMEEKMARLAALPEMLALISSDGERDSVEDEAPDGGGDDD